MNFFVFLSKGKNRIKRTMLRLKTSFYKLYMRKMGKKNIIYKPIKFVNLNHIEMGDEITIFKNCRIEPVIQYYNIFYNPLLKIGDRVSIQQNLHLTCAKRIIIEDNVAIASNVTITDIEHSYENIGIPIEKQKLKMNEVFIGKDSKIYNNAVILPGTKIGKHCVIGANSVVNRDIPDYSVAVGSPAKIVKRYDFKQKQWRKTTPDGSFLNE